MVEPSTTTSAPWSTSWASKNRPSATAGPRPCSHSVLVPTTVVVQFWLPAKSSSARCHRGHRGHVGRHVLGRQGVGVTHRQGRGRAEAGPNAGDAVVLPGRDDEQVGAERRDLRGDLCWAPSPRAHGQDHRGDADHDAEHGERRPQPVGEHALRCRCGGSRSFIAGSRRRAARRSDLAIADPHDPLGIVRHLGLVGDEHDGPAGMVQLVQQLQDLRGRPSSRGCRWARPPGSGRVRSPAPGPWPPVAVGPRRARPGGGPPGQPGPPVAGPRGPAPALVPRHAGVDERQLHVAPGVKRRQQVELLEDEADAPVADVGQLLFVEERDVLARQQVPARPWARRGSRGCASRSTCPSPTGP